ncbi:hypothetical protein QBC39DRAFT_49286 [Podospora conica]|nr:hypothetical protein QBC39DRAFT_49286 [Schizothecium conicum]
MSQPTVYLLSDEFITTEADPTTPLYHLSLSLASLTHRVSSIQFSRVVVQVGGGDTHNDPPKTTTTKLYNLVHPANAAHRTDIPAAWFTTTSDNNSEGLGNVQLLPPRRKHLPFAKPTFSALLHASATSSTSPLFPPDGGGLEPLFTARQTWAGRAWVWLDAGGKEVLAREEAPDGKQPRLVVTTTPEGMARGVEDALVALWVLRLWWGVAEEKGFREASLLEYMTPESLVPGGMDSLTKRTAGLGALAGGGAC